MGVGNETLNSVEIEIQTERDRGVREIERRAGVGYEVAMLWRKRDDAVIVVVDTVSGKHIELPVSETEDKNRAQRARELYEDPIGNLPPKLEFSEADLTEAA